MNDYHQYGVHNSNSSLFHERDEIRRLSARQRYLQSRNWENQCICLCLEQLIDHDILFYIVKGLH